MNEAQIAALRRAEVLIDNMMGGVTKIETVLLHSDVPVEQRLSRCETWIKGVPEVGATAKAWLIAAANDKDYPPL
jgi:hypothetical protein